MTTSECVGFLRDRDDFLILTHTRPDGDTLCSAAALCSALRRTGKKAGLFPNPEITEKYMSFVGEFIYSDVPEKTVNVSVDVADVKMLSNGFEGAVALCIDHHGSNSLYAENTMLDAQMAACGEIVLRVIEELCGNVTKQEADLLYIALSTDCGCFCYANTKTQTLLDAAHLVDIGADNAHLNNLFFRSFSFPRLILEGLVYSSLRSYRENRINVAVITLDMLEKAGVTENDCDDLASLAGKVEGNVVSITVRELPGGGSKASVRSNETVNASEICAHFGGGGHPMAAGCKTGLPAQELADRLVELADTHLK